MLGSTDPKRLIIRVIVSFVVKNIYIYSRRNGRLRFALLRPIAARENPKVNRSRGFALANIYIFRIV